MRYAFGLVGFLVVLGVIIWLMSAPGGELDQAKAVLDTSAKIQPQLNQIAGRGENGVDASKSAVLSPQMSSGQLSGLLVSELTSGGAYEKHFGLKQYDVIVQIGPLDVHMLDPDSATAQVLDAYQRGQPIVVHRDTQKLSLPVSGPGSEKSPGVQGLDAIKIPMH